MVLHEKGINFEVHEVDLSNKSEEFLSVSPYGKVPVLSVNGTSLYESNIVNEYLDEVYDSPKLMPENPVGLTRFREPIRVKRLGSVKGVENGQERQALLA